MHNFGTFFLLWVMAACTLCNGSFSEDLQSDHVCLLDDPDSNQCDSFCLNELRPLLNQVVLDQDQTITRDAATQEKLHSLEGQLKGVEAKLQNQLQAVLQKIENQLEAVSKKIDAAKVEIPDIVRIVNLGFERIGTRYFRIVNERVNWSTANKKCSEMGGYLAGFRNREEVNAVTKKLKQDEAYWLGYTKESAFNYISVASKKSALFLEITNEYGNLGSCVILNSGGMTNSQCTFKRYFICQADNET